MLLIYERERGERDNPSRYFYVKEKKENNIVSLSKSTYPANGT
jgi:hypothetical protein